MNITRQLMIPPFDLRIIIKKTKMKYIFEHNFRKSNYVSNTIILNTIIINFRYYLNISSYYYNERCVVPMYYCTYNIIDLYEIILNH